MRSYQLLHHINTQVKSNLFGPTYYTKSASDADMSAVLSVTSTTAADTIVANTTTVV